MLQYPTKISRKNMPKSAVVTILLINQMRNTFKAIIIYVGTALGTNMSIELRTRTWYVIPVPVESDVTLACYDQDVANQQVLHDILAWDLEAEIQDLEADPLNKHKISALRWEIIKATHELAFPLKLSKAASGHDETISQNAWKAHGIESQNLVIHRDKTFELLLGQCTLNLLEKMKYDKIDLICETS